MKKVNLRELYPSIYPSDVYIEVEDEVEGVFASDRKKEAAYERQMYRHKAQYSLDRNDGIALETLVHGLTPDIILEEQQLRKELFEAVRALPEKQARRVYAHFYLGMSITEIARQEGVSKSRVTDSIQKGLKKLCQILKN